MADPSEPDDLRDAQDRLPLAPSLPPGIRREKRRTADPLTQLMRIRNARRRAWLKAIGLASAISVLGFTIFINIGMAVVEGAWFRDRAQLTLGDRFAARVELQGIKTRGLRSAHVDRVVFSGENDPWTLVLEDVRLSLTWKTLLGNRWEIRNCEVRFMEFRPGVVTSSESDDQVQPSPRKPWPAAWGLGISGNPLDVEIRSLLVEQFSLVEADSEFVALGKLEGEYAEERLDWHFQEGILSFRLMEDLRFFTEAAGFLEEGRFHLDGAALEAETGGSIRLRSMEEGGSQPGISLISLRVDELTLPGSSNERTAISLEGVELDAEGDLWLRIPDVRDWRWTGSFRLMDFPLGTTSLCDLLGAQTGHVELRNWKADLAGDAIWQPTYLLMENLEVEDNEVARLQGNLEVESGEVKGSMVFGLPEEKLAEFPGGIPEAFTTSPDGWSTARLVLSGPQERWRENLSRGLLDQVSRELAMAPALPLMDPRAETEADPDSEERLDQWEAIFRELVD